MEEEKKNELDEQSTKGVENIVETESLQENATIISSVIKKSLPTPLIIGIVAAILVVSIALIVILIPKSNDSNNNNGNNNSGDIVDNNGDNDGNENNSDTNGSNSGNNGGGNGNVTPPDTEACTHTYGDWVTITEATCKDEGKATRKCSVCSTEENKVLDKTNEHTEVIDAAVEATCTATGLTEGKHCSVCNKVILAQNETPALAHVYDSKYDEKCNVCGFERDVGCAHSETEIIKGKDATCTATGLTDGSKCKKCGEIITAQTIIPVKAHTETTIPTVEATCTTTGLTEGTKCSVCNQTLVAQQETPMVAHTYDDKYDEACNKCGFVRDAECAHRETETITGYAASCTATGLTDGKKCKKCGEIITAQTIIPVKAHTETTIPAVEATCTQTGLTEGTKCSVCNQTLVAQQETPIVAHTYDDKYDEACNKCGFIRDAECAHRETETITGYDSSCTTTGLTDGAKCKKCGEIITAQTTIAMKPHTEVIDVAVDATCTATGLTEGKHCAVCNETLVAQTQIPTIRCIAGDWIIDKEATKSEDGKRHQECTMCGTPINDESIPATGSVGLSYTVNEDGETCTITSIGTCTDSHVVIPSVINDCTVTGIANRAFYECTTMTEVTIPASVTNIGTQIFYKSSNLTTVYYNSTYSSTQNNFLNLSHINKVVFGGSSIPYAFLQSHTNITEVEIEKSITSIDMFAFYGCTSLTDVYYKGEVEDWLGIYFQDLYSNPMCCAKKLYFNDDLVTELVIPDSVTKISSYAFSGCSGLLSIDLPNSVTSISDYAFSGCRGLTSIEIPDSVTSIGLGAFSECSSLESITLPFIGGSSTATIESSSTVFGHIFGTSGWTGGIKQYYKKSYYETYYIPASLKSVTITGGNILYGAFYGCSGLLSIDLPNSVTSISDYAFYGCTSLTSIDIPDSVTNIGEEAFYYCTSLTNVEIGASVTNIYDKAFYNCIVLTSIGIPDSATNIGEEAFYNCTSLTSIEIGDSLRNIGKNAFYNCTCLTSIEVDTKNQYYKSIDGNLYTKDGKTLIQYSIGKGTTSFTIPDSVTSIGEYQFYNCTSLTSIEIPDSVTSIGYEAFYGCTSLTSIDIPDSVTKIGARAFYNCTSITCIKIPDSVTSIGYAVFYGCKSATIYCEATSKPSGWDSSWNMSYRPVVWGYTS